MESTYDHKWWYLEQLCLVLVVNFKDSITVKISNIFQWKLGLYSFSSLTNVIKGITFQSSGYREICSGSSVLEAIFVWSLLYYFIGHPLYLPKTYIRHDISLQQNWHHCSIEVKVICMMCKQFCILSLWKNDVKCK